MNQSPLVKSSLVLAVAAALSACGGGGGGESVELAGADAARIGQLQEPAPAAAPVPGAAPVAAPSGVQLADHGGRCDGATDDTAAIARGLADAKAKNLPLVIPAGQCNFSDIIRLDGVKLAGYGASSVLYATRWERSAIFMSGAAPSVSNVKLTGVAAPSRQAAWDSTRITVFGATDFVIDGVTIEGSPAAGIQTAQAPTRGRITNNVVRNTLADSIHITDRASYLTIENNRIENSGDDGIAVVSYMYDGARVNNITARDNVIRNNRHGRNMSVVGGSNIVYSNNYMEGNSAGYACLYIVQETNVDWATRGVGNVMAERNTIKNCGGTNTGHGGVMIYSDGTEAVDNVRLQYNDIVQTNQAGIRYFGWITNTRLDQNRYSGSGAAISGSVAGVTVTPYNGGAVGYVAP